MALLASGQALLLGSEGTGGDDGDEEMGRLRDLTPTLRYAGEGDNSGCHRPYTLAFVNALATACRASLGLMLA